MGLSGWYWGAMDALGGGEGYVRVAGPPTVLSGDRSSSGETKCASCSSLPWASIWSLTESVSPCVLTGLRGSSLEGCLQVLAVAQWPGPPPPSWATAFFLRDLLVELIPQDSLLPSSHQCLLST